MEEACNDVDDLQQHQSTSNQQHQSTSDLPTSTIADFTSVDKHSNELSATADIIAQSMMTVDNSDAAFQSNSQQLTGASLPTGTDGSSAPVYEAVKLVDDGKASLPTKIVSADCIPKNVIPSAVQQHTTTSGMSHT
jgi:hypothetical protein